MGKVLEIGGERWSKDFFKNVTEEEAVRLLRHKYSKDQIINVWKQSNGFSVPNYSESEEVIEEKPKRKRKKVTPKSEESEKND